MNMWQLPIGQKAKIQGFSEEISVHEKMRLEDLGFRIDEQVLCLRKMPLGGPSVFQTQFTAFALEKDLAQKIYVESMYE